MMFNTNERYTYARFKSETIKDKLMHIDPSMNDVSTVEVINIALACFSYICDEHINADVKHGEIIHDIIDSKTEFVYNVEFIKQQANSTNFAINNLLDRYFDKYNKEAEK